MCRTSASLFLLLACCTACTEEDGRPDTGDAVPPMQNGEGVEMGGQTGEGGGPLDTCYATRWPALDAARERMECVEVYRTDASEPRAYRCSCDLDVCPPAPSIPDESADPSVDPWDDPCVTRVELDRCDAALLEVCGVEPGDQGFCEAPALVLD